jgi:hypothetical protein
MFFAGVLLGSSALAQRDSSIDHMTFSREAITAHPYFNLNGPVAKEKQLLIHQPMDKDAIFYAMVALVLFFSQIHARLVSLVF